MATTTRCMGVIDPHRVYTREGVMRAAGIGHNNLNDAKRSGIVETIRCGERVYFRGSDIIAWILSHSKRSK